jgi:hypothetical protein
MKAVKIRTPQEAAKIRRDNPERIVPSRYVYRWKPGDGLGAEAMEKVRWCVQGHHDPDLFELRRHSPTPQTSSINSFLQVAACLQRKVGIADAKTAFMQTSTEISKQQRPKGALYAEIPPGGIPLADGTWIEEGSIIELFVAVYGLANAPAAWRQTLKQALESLDYRSSRYEPCIYVLMKEDGPAGHVLLDVDDIAEQGNDTHDKKMEQLRKIFKFGKWINIYKSESDYCGRTIAQLADYSFKIHQAKFIQERLRPIPIVRGRASDKEALTTDAEKSMLRAALGSTNWVQRESRLDAAADSSLLMSRLNVSTVQDLCDCNTMIKRLQDDPFLGILLPAIPLKEVRWASIQDASWNNVKDGHTQAGFIAGVTTKELWQNKEAPFGILSFRSHKLPRKVPSTLAGEAQIMSESTAEVEWLRGLFEELTNPEFTIANWRKYTRHRGLLTAARSVDPDRKLQKYLSITDAKSLYDNLKNETAGIANDRRVAIDIQIIRGSLNDQDGEVRWVDHIGMYADALTKRNGNIPLIQLLMKTGKLIIHEEKLTLQKHADNPTKWHSKMKSNKL